MGSGEKGHLLSFQRKSHVEKAVSDVPKGFVAVKVGQDENEQQRFVVPIMYLKHPLFIRLLNEAEEEYGFEHQGAITIPCHVEEFLYVRDLIDTERGQSGNWCHKL